MTIKRLILCLPRVSGGEINGSPGQLISVDGFAMRCVASSREHALYNSCSHLRCTNRQMMMCDVCVSPWPEERNRKHVWNVFAGVFRAEPDVWHDEGNRQGKGHVWGSDWEQNNRYVQQLFVIICLIHTQVLINVTQRRSQDNRSCPNLTSGFTLQPAWLGTRLPVACASVHFQCKLSNRWNVPLEFHYTLFKKIGAVSGQ